MQVRTSGLSEVPRLGFGTYGRWGESGIAAMLAALETGYRHFDTAQSYNTEHELGEALRRAGLDRGEVFITTKIDTRNYGKGALVPSLQRSLDTLGVDRVDLTLLHWPSPRDEIPLGVYLEQIAEAESRGMTRFIGVSNFTIALIEAAEALIGSGRLLTNQIELNPHIQNRKLADFCTGRGILVTCYLPIAHGTLDGDPVLERIARRLGATVAQVALAFELHKGYAAIPTSGRPERIRENFAAQEVRLSAEDMRLIETTDRGARRIDPVWSPAWD